jgi:UDP-N-acetylmuramoyl-tripeptide--D-alanyl-D-alanine ligase
MSAWTDAQVRDALALPADAETQARRYSAVHTDTRTLAAGSLFVALAGERFDAHDYLGQAMEKGARGAVVSRVPDDAPQGMVYYRVEDTLRALGALALHRRRRLPARVCAITGTNGKTTTKEMTRAVLAAGYRVHATTGNLNNLVGTPLTILTAPDDAEALVVEVGTNAPGEIARLRDIVEPHTAIITGVAEGHLEGLGTLEGVLEEKTSLLTKLKDELAIVADSPRALPDRARQLTRHVRVAGWTELADDDLRAEAIQLDDEGRVRFRWGQRDVSLGYRGRHNARNALLALALGTEWGVRADAGVRELERLQPTKLRGEVVRFGGLRVIADCYNANPASLSAALDLLVGMPRGSGRVAVVGSMRELGPGSAALHRRAAEEIAALDVDVVVATGDFVAAFDALADALGERLIRAEEPLDAYPALAARLDGHEVVLLKGSRGVELERLMPRLEQDFSPAAGTPANGSTAAAKGD